MLVNHTHKIAFIHIPKAAGTSIRKWMMHNLECEEWGYPHDNLLRHQDRLPIGYRVFAVVRNPYNRLISHFRFHLNGGSHRQPWVSLRRILHQGGLASDRKCLRMYLDLPDVNRGADDYKNKFWYDYRFTPQHEWVKNNRFKVQVFKQEELTGTLGPWIKEVTGLDIELTRENASRTKALSLSHKLWTNDILDKVNTPFKIDCMAYGYQFKEQSTSN